MSGVAGEDRVDPGDQPFDPEVYEVRLGPLVCKLAVLWARLHLPEQRTLRDDPLLAR